jgi:hypothetical protein
MCCEGQTSHPRVIKGFNVTSVGEKSTNLTAFHPPAGSSSNSRAVSTPLVGGIKAVGGNVCAVPDGHGDFTVPKIYFGQHSPTGKPWASLMKKI